MRTHFLGREEVDAYLRDLAHRLLHLGSERPLVWCPIGPSGGNLARELLRLDAQHDDWAEVKADTKVLPVTFSRETCKVEIGAQPNDLAGQDVLVLDSSIHSGSTMAAVVKELQSLGPKSLATYTLILKNSSSFIPTYWAVTIHDHDRAYFLLTRVPNNRLDPRHPRNHGHLRRLSEADLRAVPIVESGVSSLDRVTWEDRWWSMQESKGGDPQHFTYLLEVGGAVVGYVTYTLSSSSMTIDEVAVAKDLHKNKYGGTLMRWAETMARQTSCAEIVLWAIEAGVKFYQREDYQLDSSRKDMTLDGDTFKFMRKKILYHLPPPLA